MNDKMKKLLGAATLGVLLAVGLYTDVIARTEGWLYGNTLRVASTEGRDGTPGNTLGAGDAYIQDALEVDGAAQFDGAVTLTGAVTNTGQTYSVIVATETIVAASTITANACGSLKRILAATDVTTDVTLTLTRPSSSIAGCKMLIVNVSAVSTIYLDSNALFGVTTAASLPLGPKGSVLVWTDGSVWWHSAWTEY